MLDFKEDLSVVFREPTDIQCMKSRQMRKFGRNVNAFALLTINQVKINNALIYTK